MNNNKRISRAYMSITLIYSCWSHFYVLIRFFLVLIYNNNSPMAHRLGDLHKLNTVCEHLPVTRQER